MMDIVLTNQRQVTAAHAVGERPVGVWLVLGDLEWEMVVRDDDLFGLLGGVLELFFEPGPLSVGVVLELGQVGHEGDGVKHDEAVAFVGEGGVVADVVVFAELLEGGDAVDVVVAG